MKKSAFFAAICVPAFLAAAPLAAKTLVYCSEGSPENFYPGVNTTGTSFDASEQIYDNIVDFERGGTKVTPGLAERWDVSADGTVYTFHLRKNAKWHSNKNFTPTRTANADDVVFMFERQWKEANPFFKVTSPNHSYFSDMGMPALLKTVEKVDDYTVRVTLNRPEAPFLANLAMQWASVQSKEYADAMLKAGTPGEDRPGSHRHGPVLPGAVPEGRDHPLQGVPGLLGRQGEDRRPHLLDHP
jgi:dipeptide transport system substrate-binding protein